MAEFTPSKKTAQDFNNGIEYVDGTGEIEGDAVHAESINNVIEGLLYTQGLGVNQPDVSTANQVGTASVSIIIASDGSAQLKFSQLKGEQGIGISTITANGTDANGGNKYKITLDDGRTFDFVAPKGAQGNTGNGIASTVITYAAGPSGATAPITGWQPTIPVVEKGGYLWTRTLITYTDGTTSTSYTNAYQGKDGSGGVTGVKGNAESTYRTGNVNLTPANVGLGNVANERQFSAQNLPTAVKDSYNGNPITFSHGKDSLDTASLFVAWKGYELRTITPDAMRTAMSAVNKAGDTMTGALTLNNGQEARGSVSLSQNFEYTPAYQTGFYFNAFTEYDKCFVCGDGGDKAILQWDYSSGWYARISNNGTEILAARWMDAVGSLLDNGVRVYSPNNPPPAASVALYRHTARFTFSYGGEDVDFYATTYSTLSRQLTRDEFLNRLGSGIQIGAVVYTGMQYFTIYDYIYFAAADGFQVHYFTSDLDGGQADSGTQNVLFSDVSMYSYTVVKV